MPDLGLRYDSKVAPFRGIEKDIVEKELAILLFNPMAAVFKKVLGFEPEDLELEIKPFGFRMTGVNSSPFPLGLTVVATDSKPWADNAEVRGIWYPTPTAVEMLLGEAMVMALMNSRFEHCAFTVAVRLSRGSFGLSAEARDRLNEASE